MSTLVLYWVLIPAWFGLLLYSALALTVYPYARPLLSFWLLLVAILVPPLFTLLLVYLAFALCFFPPSRIVIVQGEVATRGTRRGR